MSIELTGYMSAGVLGGSNTFRVFVVDSQQELGEVNVENV